jgi:ribosomal protein S18 acetylase RimI-like enzyme
MRSAQEMIPIEEAVCADAEEILALQRRAYQSEAAIYDDYSLPPLLETLEEIRSRFGDHLFLKAVMEGRIVGSVRAREGDRVCHVSRLIVSPEIQNRRLGTRLMREVEARFPGARRFELFTGHKSERNLHLYRKLGYRIWKTEFVHERLDLVYLAKTLPRLSVGCERAVGAVYPQE